VSGIITQPFVVKQFGEALYVGVQFSPYALAGNLFDLVEWNAR
jgi:hypothetical protein